MNTFDITLMLTSLSIVIFLIPSVLAFAAHIYLKKNSGYAISAGRLVWEFTVLVFGSMIVGTFLFGLIKGVFTSISPGLGNGLSGALLICVIYFCLMYMFIKHLLSTRILARAYSEKAEIAKHSKWMTISFLLLSVIAAVGGKII